MGIAGWLPFGLMLSVAVPHQALRQMDRPHLRTGTPIFRNRSMIMGRLNVGWQTEFRASSWCFHEEVDQRPRLRQTNNQGNSSYGPAVFGYNNLISTVYPLICVIAVRLRRRRLSAVSRKGAVGWRACSCRCVSRQGLPRSGFACRNFRQTTTAPQPSGVARLHRQALPGWSSAARSRCCCFERRDFSLAGLD